MDRRWNWFWVVPLILAPIMYAITQEAIFLWIGFGIGILIIFVFRTLTLPPDLNRAVRLYRRGDLEAAHVAATQSIEKSPDRWEAHHTRALINFGLARLGDSERDARQTVALKPDAHVGYIALGQALYWQARYEEAKEAYQRAVALNAKEGLDHHYLAMAQYRLGDYEDVAITAPFALKLGINNPSFTLLAYYYLFDSLKRLKRDDEAAEALAEMRKHQMGLEPFKEDLNSVSSYPAPARS